MDIAFPKEEFLDPTTDLIWFPAEVNGKRIRCVMEVEALQACCGADLGDPMPAFHSNRPVIEAAAARLIAGGLFEKDGSILVAAEDI